jgi:hypothetical protein
MTSLRDAGWRGLAALAAILFLTLLLSLTRVERVGLVAVVPLVFLVILSARRPSTALIILATVIPLATWLGRRWEPSVAWVEALVVAFSAGYCARQCTPARDDPDDLDGPLLLIAAVVITSLLVQLAVEVWRFGGSTVRDYLYQLVSHNYLRTIDTWEPLDAGMRLLESLVIIKAASGTARRDAAFAPLLIPAFVFGAAAASAVNIMRLWEGAIRLDTPVTAFVSYLFRQRFNAHYGDLNAAGSYFVMALFPALALARERHAWRWRLAALTIAASVWITGSRMAFLAGLVALVAPAAVAVRRVAAPRLRRLTYAAAALMLVCVAAGIMRSLPARGNQQGATTAIQVRLGLAETSLRMLAVAPAFGVGIGRYPSRSGEFSSPELLRIFPLAAHENAHNNFLQILAELGIVGLAAVIWLLAVAVRASARLVRADRPDPLRWAVVTGLLAFVLSWLGGHPLLIDEPAFTFWLLLGTASGWSSPPPPRHSRPASWLAGALLVILAASIPVRARAERAEFNLEHQGIGLSGWRDEVEGVRYRLAGRTSSVFVPSGTRAFAVPLRAAGPRGELRVELWLDGRLADIVRVPSDRWLSVQLLLPTGSKAPRFRRLEFRIPGVSSSDSEVLMIGKVQPR